jgi:hypothetical protein
MARSAQGTFGPLAVPPAAQALDPDAQDHGPPVFQQRQRGRQAGGSGLVHQLGSTLGQDLPSPRPVEAHGRRHERDHARRPGHLPEQAGAGSHYKGAGVTGRRIGSKVDGACHRQHDGQGALRHGKVPRDCARQQRLATPGADPRYRYVRCVSRQGQGRHCHGTMLHHGRAPGAGTKGPMSKAQALVSGDRIL